MNFSDFSSPEFFSDPYPLYRRIRDEGPFLSIAPQVLLTGKHDVIDALLLDRRMGKTYMESVIARYGEQARDQPVFRALSRMFLMMNPPSHTRLRGLLSRAFNASQVDMFREATEKTANDLIDKFLTKSSFDLITEYASPLPINIICRLLDILPEDGIALSESASLLAQALDAAPLDERKLAQSNEATDVLETFFQDVVRQRQEKLGNDLISALIQADLNGDRLTDDEIVSNVLLLFVAGHETTSNMLGNALITLHRHPEQLALLRRDQSLVTDAVNECLRYDTSVQMVVRTASENIDVGGTLVPRGSMVFMMLGAANRDPDHFSDADRFDIRRQFEGRQLSFGGGVHFCLGSRLAALEIGIGISALLARLPNLSITNLDALNWRPRNNLRGVSALFGTNVI